MLLGGELTIAWSGGTGGTGGTGGAGGAGGDRRNVFRISNAYGVAASSFGDGITHQYDYRRQAACGEELWLQLAALRMWSRR